MNPCPCCSNATGNPRYSESIGHSSVFRCHRCGAVFGSCYLGDSYAIVRPEWHAGEEGEQFYFDLECLGSAGITRRHGWANVSTRRITQTG